MGKFIVLQTIGVVGLISAYFSGILPLIWNADHVHAIPIIGAMFVWGLVCTVLKDRDGAGWIADKLPVVSLVYTVLGLIMAVHRAQGMDLDAARMQVFTDVAYSLVANMTGMAGYFWLSLTDRICK